MLRSVVRQVGSKVLNFKPDRVKGKVSNWSVGASINTSGRASKNVILDTGSSDVAGSDGKYNMEVSSQNIGVNGKFDISDVNRLKISLGSASDGGPLFGLTIYHLDKRWTDGPRDENCWYNVNGTAILNSGERVSFNGTPQTQYVNQPEIFLDSEEAAASGSVMRGIIDDALNGVPTHLVEPPVKQLQ